MVSMLKRVWPLVRDPDPWGSELHRLGLDWRLAQAAARTVTLQRQGAEAAARLLAAYEVSGHAELLDTIPGNPRVATACVRGLTGDLNRFDRPRAVVKFAGNDPVWDQSGGRHGATKIRGRGDNRLRGAAYRAADWLRGLGRNPFFRSRDNALRRRSENRLAHREAVVACSDTYLRLIAVMVHKRMTYDQYCRDAHIDPSPK